MANPNQPQQPQSTQQKQQGQQSTSAPSQQQQQSKEIQRRPQRWWGSEQAGLSRRDPLFGLGPSFLTSPFGFMRRFAEEMDRFFEDANWPLARATREARMTPWDQSVWSPQVEVFERDGMLFIRADLPGLSKSDVHVDISNDELTIEGERRFEHEDKRGDIYRSERSYGTFRRTILLPPDVKTDDVTAMFNNGVLEISLKRMPQGAQQRRQLEIQEGSTPTTGQRH